MERPDIDMTPLDRKVAATKQGAIFAALCEFDTRLNTPVNNESPYADMMEVLRQHLRANDDRIPAALWPDILGQFGLGLDSDMGAMIRALTELRFAAQPVREVEAITIRPGMGEMLRWKQAIDALQSGQLLLIMGANRGEKTWRSTPEILEDFGIDPGANWIRFQPEARNTKDQSNWLVRTVRDLRIRTLAGSVAKYHQARAFGTDVATLGDFGLGESVVMFPFPTSDVPANLIPETGLTMGSSYQGELKRMNTYIAAGHVATWDVLYNYLMKVVKQHPLGA